MCVLKPISGFDINRGYVMKFNKTYALYMMVALCVMLRIESASYWNTFTNMFTRQSPEVVLAQLEDAFNNGQLKELLLRHDFTIEAALLRRLANAGYIQFAQHVNEETVAHLIAYLRDTLSPAASALDRKNVQLLTDAASSLVKKYKHYFTLDKQIQAGAAALAKLVAMIKQRGALQQNLERLGGLVAGPAKAQIFSNLAAGIGQAGRTDQALKTLGITEKLLKAPIPPEIVQPTASYWQQYGQPVAGFTTSALTGLGGFASSGVGFVGTQTGLSNYISPQILGIINHYPQIRNLLLGLALAGAGTYGGYKYITNKPQQIDILSSRKEGESVEAYIRRLKSTRDEFIRLAARNVGNKITMEEMRKNTIAALNAKIAQLESQQQPWYKRWFSGPSTANSSPIVKQTNSTQTFQDMEQEIVSGITKLEAEAQQQHRWYNKLFSWLSTASSSATTKQPAQRESPEEASAVLQEPPEGAGIQDEPVGHSAQQPERSAPRQSQSPGVSIGTLD